MYTTGAAVCTAVSTDILFVYICRICSGLAIVRKDGKNAAQDIAAAVDSLLLPH